MYHDQDAFDFIQGHVTKNQPMAVPVQLSKSLEYNNGYYRDITLESTRV